MINVKRIIKQNRLIIVIIVFVLILLFLPITYSKFQSGGNSITEIETAFYIMDTNYETKSIHIDNLVPSDMVHTYNFSVSNNDGVNRAETDMEYYVEIVTTTNLPLNYALYLNQTYSDNGSTNIITSDIVEADEYGTYFKKMKTDSKLFSHTKDESNTYQLTIVFPLEYTNIEYQDIIEGININVYSKQKLKEQSAPSV